MDDFERYRRMMGEPPRAPERPSDFRARFTVLNAEEARAAFIRERKQATNLLADLSLARLSAIDAADGPTMRDYDRMRAQIRRGSGIPSVYYGDNRPYHDGQRPTEIVMDEMP